MSATVPFRDSSFALAHRADGISNGTSLWLGAHVLPVFVAAVLPLKPDARRPRALELGSGVGFSA